MFSLQDYTRDPRIQYEVGLRNLDMSEVKQIQTILLDIYKDVMYVCEKYHLKIMLAGGSALGAVRHAGFIPWDDDMDMIMPRDDFDRFVHLFLGEYNDKYHVISPFQKGKSANFFIRVIDKNSEFISLFDPSKRYHSGIAFEITPIDFVPENKLVRIIKGVFSDLFLFTLNSRMIFEFRNKYSDRLFYMSVKSSIFYIFRIILGLFTCFISYSKLLKLYDDFARNNKNTSSVTIACGRNHYFGEMHSKEIFFPPKEIYFENIRSYVPNNCDAYLRKLYGENYMQIPPKEQREPHPCIKLIFNKI